jgi:hypothetical protein
MLVKRRSRPTMAHDDRASAMPFAASIPCARAIVHARAEIRDLIEPGDLSHHQITASWLEVRAANVLAKEREAA